LSLYTGANERSCYRYAEGSRDPTVPFLRRLIQSEYGLPFHAAFMDGCRAEWWVSLQRKLRNGGRVEEAKFE
jgi:hypothetical protein